MRLALGGSTGSRLLVFCWHNVEATWREPSVPGAGARRLARQLRAIRTARTVVPLDEALDALEGGRPLPPRATALTFDDGFRDHLTVAAPLLSSLGLPATMFLVPGILSGEVDPWKERLSWAFGRARAACVEFEGTRFEVSATGLEAIEQRLAPRERTSRDAAVEAIVEGLQPGGTYSSHELYLDWDDAPQLVKAGLAIGSHSMYHESMSRQTPEAQQVELRESRHLLQTKLEVPVHALAYPYGRRRDFDSATVEAARAAGYRHALTTLPVWTQPSTPPYEVRRSAVTPRYGVPGLVGALARGVASAALGRG